MGELNDTFDMFTFWGGSDWIIQDDSSTINTGGFTTEYIGILVDLPWFKRWIMSLGVWKGLYSGK